MVGASGFEPPTSWSEPAFINNLRGSFAENRDFRVFCVDPIRTLKSNVWPNRAMVVPCLDPGVPGGSPRAFARTRRRKADGKIHAQRGFENRSIGAGLGHGHGATWIAGDGDKDP